MSDRVRTELATFLRSRRERLTPERVGLPAGGRRRTPGLRREEVAQLAGVGVTWYTWLEQGRRINASLSVLEAVARALHLDPDERQHLFALAGVAAPSTEARGCAIITDEHLMVLQRLLPLPACIQSAKFDILASNRTYRFMINDLNDGPESERSCLVRAFTDPDWVAAYDDYTGVTARMAARLRTAMASHLDDPSWVSLVDHLQAESTHFAHLWEQRELASAGSERELFHLPRVGDVRLRFTRLWLDNPATVHLVILSPEGPADTERIDRLDRLTRDLGPAVTARSTVTAQPARAA